MTVAAWHYDGKTALRRAVTVEVRGSFCEIFEEGGPSSSTAWTDLEAMQSREIQVIYRHKTIEGWRLGFPGGVPETLAHLLPKRAKIGGFIDRVGLIPAALGFTALSLGVALLALKVPEWMAPFVPIAWEKSLSVGLMASIKPSFCHSPKVDAAVKAMAKSIDPAFDSQKIHIANIDMVNAIAVPGGDIILFDGLIKKATSSSEVIGILGHEMGHVENRDIMKSLLRQFGVSIAFGGMDGGLTGYASMITSAGFDREAESDADEHAIKLMKAAAISPVPMAEFFMRLAKEEPVQDKTGKAILGYLNSHPFSEARERAFRQSAKGRSTFVSPISDADWSLITTACDNNPDRSFDNFTF